MGLGRLRAALAAAGAAPRKRHGQHFLLDENMLAAIVRDAGVGPGQVVLEVGPGPGLLTRHLLAAGARVVAIEIDPAMRRVAESIVEPALWAGLEWIEGDVLEGARTLSSRAASAAARADRLVSNLPYGIAAPLLGALLLEPAPGPDPLLVMVQREIAERLAARPGTRDWGPLAVIAALAATVTVRRRVPPGSFWPVPRVESVVVEVARREGLPDPAALPGGAPALSRFLAAAFHNRRKTLVNSLAVASGLTPAAVAARLAGSAAEGGLRPRHAGGGGASDAAPEPPGGRPAPWTRRAEAFDELELYDLARHWAETALGERHRPDP